MSKVTLSNLANLTNEQTAVSTINNNNAAITAAMEKTLSRDGTTPNTMGTLLDMNSNKIINLPEATTATEPVRFAEFESLVVSTGTGNVVGPASSADNNLPSFNGTSGKILKDSGLPSAQIPRKDLAQTWTLTQTFTVAPVFTDASGSRTALGLGTAATQNTGTSGANVPLLNGNNTWSGTATWSALATFTGKMTQTVSFTGSAAQTNLGFDQFVTRTASSTTDAVYGNRTYLTDNGTSAPTTLAGYISTIQYNQAANNVAANYCIQASGQIFASIAQHNGIASTLYVDTGKTLGVYNAYYATAPGGPGSVTTKRAFLADAGAGPIVQNDTTASTSTTTGALQVAGGAGVAGDVFVGGRVTAASTVAPPAGGSSSARLLLSSTANLGIYFGSGAPTVSAAQGSIYIRTDGAINARLYINTNGSTTWTAFNTAS